MSQAAAAPRGERLAALWKGGLGEDAVGWLEARGWQAAGHDLAGLAESYGRPAPAASRSGLVTATRIG